MKLIRWYSKPLNHKCFEFNLDVWGFKRGILWRFVSIENTYRSDHGGFHFMAGFCNLQLEFDFYDTRHWNEAAGRYNLEGEYDA